jgi:hypothetical protein
MYGIALASLVPGDSQVMLAVRDGLDVNAVELPEPVAASGASK